MRRGLLVIAAAALLAGCATDTGTADGAAPKRSSAAVLAVTVHGKPAVSLYRVTRDRQAHLVGAVQPPAAGEHAVAWSLSGGDKPDLCVVWRTATSGELWCYPFGRQGSAVRLDAKGIPADVALRPDGRAVAWTVDDGSAQTVVTADYAKGSAKHTKVLNKGKDQGFWAEEQVLGLAWATDHVLVLERPRAEGRPGGYELVDVLRVPPDGWGVNALSVDPTAPDADRGFDYLTGVRSATIDWVLSVEGGRAAARAVRAAIGDGRVLQVVGVPARHVVTGVSGSVGGVVVTTRYGGAVHVLLALAGEKTAVRIGGLPASVADAVGAP